MKNLFFLQASIMMHCACMHVFVPQDFWILVFCRLKIQKRTFLLFPRKLSFHFKIHLKFLKGNSTCHNPADTRPDQRQVRSIKHSGSLSLIKYLSKRESRGYALQTHPTCPANVYHISGRGSFQKQTVPSENVLTSGGHVINDLRNFFWAK